ncbi:MAG: MOSC domain-containing protein [Streptomycetaceae bacterium]|nr:MOSC domain-containing protein [Streptomycetaceae bacterium]
MATVVELNVYPVKGCAALPVGEAVLRYPGLAHDRTFLVVDDRGVFRSQRTDPRLALIRAGVDADGMRLTLRTGEPDGAPADLPADELHVDVDTESARVDVEMFRTPYRAIDQGPEAAAWLTAVLGVPSRLVRVPPEHERVTKGVFPGTAAFADSGALLVLSRASLAGLNTRLVDGGGAALPMARFRPNVVVDGWDAAHREDDARRVTIGAAEIGFAKKATRCVVTTVDQVRGVKSGPEPLRTLAAYRRGPDGGVVFGAQYSVLTPGKLTVGDQVVVTEWA